MNMNKIRFAKILLTLTAIQLGFIPAVVDLTESHVFHHDWPPHAKFHMVWLVTLGLSLSTYVLVLIWKPSYQNLKNMKHASLLGSLVLLGFFTATLTQNIYGGALADPVHQKLVFGTDANLVSFSIACILQVMALKIIWLPKP